MNASVFNETKKLKILRLNFNALTAIDLNVFKGLFRLEKLFISNNILENLHSNNFVDLKSLHLLNLVSNQLTHIDSSVLNGLFKKCDIYLKDNYLDEADLSVLRTKFYKLKN